MLDILTLSDQSHDYFTWIDTGIVSHKKFADLIDLIEPNDLLIFNNTKYAARIYGNKSTGGKVEVMIERLTSGSRELAQIKSSKSLKLKFNLFKKRSWFKSC